MNRFALAVLCLLVLSMPATGDENYILTVNGVSREIGLDQDSTFVLPDGTSLTLNLILKEYQKFSGEYFSFEHRNEYLPKRQDLGDGMYQTMMVTPVGTGVIVQEFMNVDPTPLIDLMIKEITKEEVEYGYEYEEKSVEKTIRGVALTGKQAVTTYKDEQWTRDVFAVGGKDKGVLIITMIESENAEADQDFIDHFWKTIRVDESIN